MNLEKLLLQYSVLKITPKRIDQWNDMRDEKMLLFAATRSPNSLRLSILEKLAALQCEHNAFLKVLVHNLYCDSYKVASETLALCYAHFSDDYLKKQEAFLVARWRLIERMVFINNRQRRAWKPDLSPTPYKSGKEDMEQLRYAKQRIKRGMCRF